MNDRLLDKRKINVMHVVFSIGVGGLEKMTLELCRRMNNERFERSVCCLSTDEDFLALDFAAAGIPVHYLPKKEGLMFSLPLHMAKLFRQEKIDIVHTHDGTANLYGTIGARLAGVKIIFNTEHGMILFDTNRKRFINKYLAMLNDRMVCVSQQVETELLRMGINKEKLIVISNGIDLDSFSYSSDKDSIRRELGYGPEEYLICNVGRCTVEKNQKLLIDALAILLPNIPNLRVILAGDGVLRKELEAYTIKLGVNQKVSFLGDRKDIPEILLSSDSYVLCSNYESFGLSIVEAMAAQLPVITTDVGGVRSIVQNNLNGIIIPRNDTAALAKAILSIHNEPEKAQLLAKRARENAHRFYSINTTVRQYEDLYLKVFSSKNYTDKCQTLSLFQ